MNPRTEAAPSRDPIQETIALSQTVSVSENCENNVLKSIYGSADIPLFGPRYSTPGQIENVSQVRESTISMRIETLNPYEEIIGNADADLREAYFKSMNTFSAENAGGKFMFVKSSPKMFTILIMILPLALNCPLRL